VVFTVSDQGKGIDQEIIDESIRSEGRQQPFTAPSGTGLKRVFRVSDFRNWNVRYDNSPPGATFYVEVPIRKSDE
jgi:sensor histidine kinase regulating citrate/malate metabolism